MTLRATLQSPRAPRNFPAISPTKAAAQEWAVTREAELRSIDGRQGSKTHTVGDVLDDYQRKISPTKRGARWEKLRLDLIGRKKIDGCWVTVRVSMTWKAAPCASRPITSTRRVGPG